MPDKVKISELDTATSVTGSTYLAVDDGESTKKITVDNYNSSANTTARGYALQAATSASEAADSAAAAVRTSDEVELSINRAIEIAGQAANSATAAAGYASDSHRDASAAATSALSASQSAAAAQSSASAVDSAATLSRSWAVGGTNTRVNEDVNNSKYWAERASDAAGGGVQTFNNRHGYVMPQDGDYSASMVNFSNSGTDISATKVQAALVEVNTKVNSKAPTNHAINGSTYGLGTSSVFGHTKLSDSYNALVGEASQGIGASQKALYDSYSELADDISGLNSDVSTLDGKVDSNVSDLNASINLLSTTTGNQYRELKSELTANDRQIYMDYHDGRYGINTSSSRGADTFIPFKGGFTVGPLQFNNLITVVDNPSYEAEFSAASGDITFDVSDFSSVTFGTITESHSNTYDSGTINYKLDSGSWVSASSDLVVDVSSASTITVQASFGASGNNAQRREISITVSSLTFA